MPSTPNTHISARERREFPRYTLDRDLTVPVRLGSESRNCRLDDISLGGACLTFEETPDPRAPDVIFESDEHGRFSAEKCWQAGQKLGVRFDFSEAALAFVTEHLRAA